jgi:hypothetical protein
MSSSNEDAQGSASQPQWLKFLAQHRSLVRTAFLVLGVALAALPTVLGVRYGTEYLTLLLATVLFPIGMVGDALRDMFRSGERVTKEDATRLMLMNEAFLFGVNLQVVGFALVATWWEYISGGPDSWKSDEGRWRILVFLLVVASGLALMFLSVQLGRTKERTNSRLSRLVYGYNAALAGMLLLVTLGFTNVLANSYFKPSYDWTTTSIYSLSPGSESKLEGLTKTTRVVVMLPRNDELDTMRRMQALLDNCKTISDKIVVENLSPDIDRERIAQLQQKYNFTDRVGILVLYGNEPNIEYQFIKGSALYTGSNPMGRQRDTRLFKGESELMNAISFVSAGKKKPIVYFTQSDKELDITDSTSKEIDRGAGLLKERLERDNVTVKGLQFSTVEGLKPKNPDFVVSNTVPNDAAMVVLAGPQQPLPDYAIKALREYMTPTGVGEGKPKGKLIVLLDVASTADGSKVRRLGIEDLLTEFQVQVGENRILQVGLLNAGTHPSLVPVTANQSQDVQARNPLAAAFARINLPLFYNVREVRPVTSPPGKPDAGLHQAETILVVPQEVAAWADSDLQANPVELVRNLTKRERRQELLAKISQEDIPIAVTVTDQPPAMDPHARLEGSGGSPRMVVVGDSTFVSNWALEGGRSRTYDLFFGMLSWLRERPTDIGIEPKKQDVYDADPNINFRRLIWLPTALMLVGILGVGTGVWVVRRK